MPRPKRRFLQFNANDQSNMSASSQSSSIPQKLQRCFVCYNQFTPFVLTTDKWESSMIKMFYSALNLPSPDDGEDDDDDPIISLPFCPQCHSKISVMSSLHGQLQIIQSQFSNIRNDVVFTIVETNEKNCRNGPMDFIRQQIFDKWKDRYEEAKAKAYLEKPIGLDSIAAELGASAKTVSEDLLYPGSEDTSLIDEFTNSLGIAVSPFGGIQSSKFPNTVAQAPAVVNTSRKVEKQNSAISTGGQPPVSKRPPRTAALANFLMYNESASMARFREMEAMVKSMGSPPMPKLIPMGMHGSRGKRIGRDHLSGLAESSNEKIVRSKGNPNSPGSVSVSPGKISLDGQSGSPVKRTNSTEDDPNKIPIKVARLRPGGKRRVHVPSKIKFQVKRGKPGRPFGWRKPAVANSPSPRPENELMDTSDNVDPADISFNDSEGSGLNDMELDDATGNFACRLCPKIYYNISRLRRHYSLCHPATKALQCTMCPNGFSSMLAFRRHMQNQHHQSLGGITTIVCAICRKGFVKQSAFDAHMKTHEKTIQSNLPAETSSELPRQISGHPSRKKPGPKPRAKDLPLLALKLEPGSVEIRNSENNDISTESNIVDDEEVLTHAIPQSKAVSQKKKSSYFIGRKKRRRARRPAGAPPTKLPDVIKNEQGELVKRVIIPRKRLTHEAPIRKSMRRAEVNTKPTKDPLALSNIETASEEGNRSGKIVEVNASVQETTKSKPVLEQRLNSTKTVVTEPQIEPSSNRKVPAHIVVQPGNSTKMEQKITLEYTDKLQETNLSTTTPKKKEKPSTRNSSKQSNGVTSPRGRLVCPICDLEYPFIGLLNMHLNSHTRDETKCEDCNAQLSTVEEYRRHIVSTHDRQLFECPTCGEEFGNKNYLGGHEIIHKFERKGRADKQTTVEASNSISNNTSNDGSKSDNKLNSIKKQANDSIYDFTDTSDEPVPKNKKIPPSTETDAPGEPASKIKNVHPSSESENLTASNVKKENTGPADGSKLTEASTSNGGSTENNEASSRPSIPVDLI